LDYMAAGRLDATELIEAAAGMADACVEAGCSLLGGETAEVPGLLADDQLELAGFAVGVAEREALPDPTRVRVGDAVIGLAASGPHSNGFSLIRKVLERAGVVASDGRLDIGYRPEGWDKPLLDALLEPTRIYVRSVRPLLGTGCIRGLAHITGGGLPENLPRALPRGLGLRLDPDAWPVPPVFRWLEGAGGIERQELYATFNMGIGFALIVDRQAADRVVARLTGEQGMAAWVIGEVVRGEGVSGLC
ncbi:MAG TPA: phosphoribosylformylglycinamidine cyclo-ligase, partial [Bacillota bacterium]